MVSLNYFVKSTPTTEGFYKVYIRLIYKRTARYIPTSIVVTKLGLNAKRKITDPAVLPALNSILLTYRKRLYDIGDIDELNAEQILDVIKKKRKEELNIFLFHRNEVIHIQNAVSAFCMFC